MEVQTLHHNQVKEVTLIFKTHEKIIQHKAGLVNLAEELGNVSKACKVMGVSREIFYRYQSAVEEGGIEVLFEVSRHQPNTKNRVDNRVYSSPQEVSIVSDYGIN